MGLYGYEVARGRVAFTDLQSMPIVWLMLALGVLLFILGLLAHIVRPETARISDQKISLRVRS